MPSQRRVKRVNLRGEAVFGTDFSFEDILPRELEDAGYVRLADENTLGRDCFVIEAIPNELASSEYSRIVIHVDKEHSVPLLTRYWDDRNIEIKELKADPDSIEQIEDVWLAKKMTMRHLKLETYTRYELKSVKPNAKLADNVFELRRLESHGR
jgi:outer membrane lipoprotein-sorting protein